MFAIFKPHPLLTYINWQRKIEKPLIVFFVRVDLDNVSTRN